MVASSQTISDGNTITFSGTSNEVDVAVSATDTVTIGLPATINVTGNVSGSSGSTTGAATATALETARTIGGVDGTVIFDGKQHKINIGLSEHYQ